LIVLCARAGFIAGPACAQPMDAVQSDMVASARKVAIVFASVIVMALLFRRGANRSRGLFRRIRKESGDRESTVDRGSRNRVELAAARASRPN
jgi:hypothetical protein